MYESLDDVPDDLLLFMHHVPYTHVLKSGEDRDSAPLRRALPAAQRRPPVFVERWRSLDGVDRSRALRGRPLPARVPGRPRRRVARRCDELVPMDLRRSRCARARGTQSESRRSGSHAARSLRRRRGDAVGNGLGGQAIRCPSGRCTAATTFGGTSGAYDIVVQYFDENDGASSFTLFVGNRRVDAWVADDVLPSREPNGHTSTRRVIRNIQLKPGDVVRIEAAPDKDEFAVVDYVEIVPRRSS